MKVFKFLAVAAVFASASAFAQDARFDCEFEDGCVAEGTIEFEATGLNDSETIGEADIEIVCEDKKGEFRLEDDEARVKFDDDNLIIKAEEDDNKAYLAMENFVVNSVESLQSIEFDSSLKINRGERADGECELRFLTPAAL